MMNIENCPRCGKIFVKNIRGVCYACMKELDQQCNQCIEYLRENRQCMIQELSEATGVSVKQITLFIREGRISIADNPKLAYSCEVCGTMIREHKICDGCRQRLAKGIKDAEEDEKRKQEARSQEGRMSYNIRDRLKNRIDDN